MALIISVPHAGTRIVRDCVGCDFAHVYVRDHPEWEGFTDPVLISPLRDPRAVWRSWVKRWNTQQGPVGLHLFERCWKHLEKLDQDYGLFYIPVDHPARAAQLELLSVLLRKKLEIDWDAKTGHLEGSTETDHPEPDWDYIYALPMVKQYYEDRRQN